MIVIPIPGPYSSVRPKDRGAHLREVARRRWQVRREQEQLELRKRRTEAVEKRMSLPQALRPGRAAASSLSPVYSMFTHALFR